MTPSTSSDARRGPAEPRDPPLVSVVLPTRNRADLLEEAVASVLEQTYPRLELVVVDDASTDRTPELLQRLEAGEPRLRVVTLSEPGGAAAARNAGIRAARGAYVAFQDDDCRWAPHKLERMVGALEEAGPGVGFAYSRMVMLEVDGAERHLGAMFGELKERGPWSSATPAVVVDADILSGVGGFDAALPRLQDFDLWVRVLDRTGWIFVDEPLLRMRRTGPGISASGEWLVQAVEILDGKYGEGTLPPGDRAALHHVLGHTLMTDGFPGRARRHFLTALRISPTRVRSLLALAAAALGRRVYLRAASWREAIDAALGRGRE